MKNGKLHLQPAALPNGHFGGRSILSEEQKLQFIKEAQREIVKKKKRKTRKVSAPAEEKLTLREVIGVLRMQRVIDEKNKERTRRREHEKTIRSLEKTIDKQIEEEKHLQHLLAEHKKQLTQVYDSSVLLQQVPPVLQKSKNPFKQIKFWKDYSQKRKLYENAIKVNSTATYLPLVESQEENIKIENNGTLDYKNDSLSVYDKMLTIGDKWVRMYYLADLPRLLKPSALFTMLATPVPLHMSVFIKPLPNREVLKKAKTRIITLNTLQDLRTKQSKPRDPEIDKYIQENEEIVDNVINERERLFEFALYMEVEAQSKQELLAFDKEFRNVMESKELLFNTYSYGQKEALQNFMPFTVDTPREQMYLDTSAVSVLMPYNMRQLYNPKGVFIGTNVYHNSVIFLNLFTQMNSNMNIFGVSGSGKSVTSKILASRLYMRGAQIIIIDVEGEYVKLARKLGGEVIQFSIKEGVNPFSMYSTPDNLKEDMVRHIDVLKSFFKFFIHPENYNATILDGVLMSIYKNYPEKKPVFKEFLAKLKGTSMYKDIAVLDSGSLKGVFNSTRELELGNDFVVFDISPLKETKMEKPAMYLLTSLVWQLVDKNREKRKMLFIDEAHELLRDPDVAAFYQKVVKEARKRSLGVVSITQDVDDFLRSDFGHAIVTCSLTTILLRQSYATLPFIDKVCGMSDKQREDLAELTNGECVIVRENEMIGAYIEVLPSEKELVFTQSAEYDENS